MADSFLTKTTLEREGILEVSGRNALESHSALREIIASRISEEAADVFAEPVLSRGNDEAPPTVSWYVPWSGEGRLLSALDAEQRARAESVLTERLVALSSLFNDPDYGLLVGAALHVRSADDIWVVDGNPVLVNWGTVPPGVAKSRPRRDRHFADTLGRFLPLSSAPPLTASEWQSRAGVAGETPAPVRKVDEAPEPRAAAATAALTATAASRGATPTASPAGPPEPPGHAVIDAAPRRSGWVHWTPLVILLLLTGSALAWLLVPGTRLFPLPPPPVLVDDARSTEIAEDINRSLEARAEALEAAIAEATCTDQGQLILSDGHLPDGTMPPVITDGEIQDPDVPVPVTGEPWLPTGPKQVAVNQGVPGDDGTITSRPTDLLDLLETQTVFVLADGATTGNIGSGFFVAPDLVVTNHHVVAGSAGGGAVFVTSKALGSLHEARVLVSEGPLETTGTDFAILHVDGVRQPFFTLRSTTETLKLQRVVAAGYPGAIIETDPAYHALLSGDATAIPDMSVTQGIVNTEQDFTNVTRVLIHTARISPGNSGGPLVDSCGRAVGVNTFGRTADERHLNFSIASTDLIRFLSSNGFDVSEDSGGCEAMAVPSGAVDIAETLEQP